MDLPLATSAQTARNSVAPAKFPRRWVFGISILSALCCVAEGFALMLRRNDMQYLPLGMLRFTPLHDYLVPGLTLVLVVGGA